MLSKRVAFALVLAAALGVGSARAQDAGAVVAKAEAVKSDIGLPPTDAPYPHIYQAPLFGSLFALANNEPAVDESALRYYASLHNIARANAEINRLKALHPNWTPPTNIYSAAGAGADEQPFWDLLAADRLEELRAGIALKARKQPGWKPSRDLVSKIERKASIEDLIRKSDAKKPAEALAVADRDPSILHCAYMDANWRVADAFIDVKMPKRAYEIFHAIIAACPDHEERLATVRKAISRFSFDESAALIAMGAKSADGASEFDAAKVDLTRARVAAANQGKLSEPIDADALAAFFADVARSKAPADLTLAGWFEYNRGHPDKAEHWFSLAKLGSPAGAGATMINLAEGRALALIKLNRFEDAFQLARAWRDVSKTMRDAYVGAGALLLTRAAPPPKIDDAALAEFAAFVEADRNFAGAQAIGWYRLNRAQWDEALSEFKTALLWKGVDPQVKPAEVAPEIAGAIEGYGRALARVGRLDEAADIADLWRGGGASLETLFLNLVGAAVDAAPTAAALKPAQLGHYADLVRARSDADLAAGLGWLDYRGADFVGAANWFREALRWGRGRGSLAASQGLALALKQSGKLAEAEEIAWNFVRDSADMRAIYISAVVAELSESHASLPSRRLDRFVAVVTAQRSAAGAQALGWYRLKDGDCAYAAPWFRRAAAWSAAATDDSGTARGLALSLKKVGAFAEAEALAYAWRERDPGLRALYVDIAVAALSSEAPAVSFSEARVARLSQWALKERNVAAARALGWLRYRQAGCGFGGRWLSLAVDWGDADKRDVKTDEGLGLSLRATGRLAEAARLAWPWVDKAPLMKKLYIDVMAQALSRDNPPEPVDEERLAEFAKLIEAAKSPLGSQALGWYRLERGEYDAAARAFKAALDWWPQRRGGAQPAAAGDDYKPVLAKLALLHADYRRTPRAYPNTSASRAESAYVETFEGLAKTQEGYTQTLRALGRSEEAEAIAWAWREQWPSLGRLFLDIAVDALNGKDSLKISPERLARFAVAIDDARSAPAAAAMAWRDLRAQRPDEAARRFEQAMAWSPPGVPEPGWVEGYVAALQAKGRFDDADAFAARWRGTSPRYDLIYLQTQVQALRASGGGASGAKYERIALDVLSSHSGEGALSLGWLAYETKDFAHALDWFQSAVAWGGAPEKAKEGVALALRAAQRFEELAAFGYAERGVPAVHDAYYGGMIAWLTADKRDIDPAARGRFEEVVAAERSVPGAQALGWGSALRGQAPEARQWFENGIAWSGFDPLAAPEKPAVERIKLVEGYAQAVRATGDLGRAEDVAYVWRGESRAIAALYLQIVTSEIADDAAAPAPQRLARFAGFATAERSADAAAALGWRFYRAKAAPDAIAWFERALAWSSPGTAPKKVTEGYVLSLRLGGRLADAESFAYGLVKNPDMRALYLSTVTAELADAKVALDGPRLDRFVTEVVAARSAIGAKALGWRRLAQDNCVYAAPWFRKAAAWSADSADDADTARGLALSLRKAGGFAEAEAIAYVWSDRAPDMDKLYVDIGVEALARLAPPSEARVARLSQRLLAERNVVGARALGWFRYAQAGCSYGGDWFRLAAAWNDADKRDAKTDEGYALALRATGRLGEAEALAYSWAESLPAMKTLYVEIAVDALSRDNPPEPISETRLSALMAVIAPARSALGAQALGWYRLERGELDEAARWFKLALDWQAPPPPRGRRLPAPVDDYQPILAKLALTPDDYRRTPRAFPNTSARTDAASYVDTEQGLAKTEEGYAQTLRALGRMEEAEAIAWAWRDRAPSFAALYLDIAVAEINRTEGPPLSAERLQRYGQAIEADRSVDGAAAFGWRLYRLGAFDRAAAWFQTGMGWASSPPRSLVEGYVMALQGAKRFAAAEAAAAKWRSGSPELNLLFVRAELERMSAAGKGGALPPGALAEIESAMARAKSAEGALALAYVALNARDYGLALAWFRKAQEWSADAGAVKPQEGIALSLRGLERWEELAEFGFPRRKVSPVLREAYFGGMVAWLTSDKPLLPVNAEARAAYETAVAEERSVIGAQALAWGALKRKDWTLSRKWFETAIDWSGFDALAPLKPADPTHAKLAEGYAQALRGAGDLARAEEVAYVWRDAGAALAGLYLQIFTAELSIEGGDLSEERIARFAAVAEAKRSAPGAGALGWRAYRVKAFDDARGWFGKAMAWSPGADGDAKINEGYALTLRAAGRLVEAEDFAWAHRAQSREIRAAYVAAVSDQLLDPQLSLSPLRLARFGQIVVTEKIGAGAAALGWRRLRDGNCGYSLNWFRKAIAWSPRGPDDAKLYAGLAQGLRAVGMFNQAEDAAYAFADRSAQARDLYINIAIEELTRDWPRVEMSEPRIARFSSVVTAGRSAAGAQALAWRRYAQADCGYGARWFELSAGWSADKVGDAPLNEGYALSLRAVGRLARAEALSFPWIERAPAMKKLYIDIAVDELSRDNPPEPIPEARAAQFQAAFASRRSGLGAQALGWYRFSRHEYEAAARAFESALDWWPPHRGDAKLAAPLDDYQPILARLAFRPEDYRRTPHAYPNSSLRTAQAEDSDVGLAKTVEGYVRTLIALSRFDQAETLGFNWLDRWPPLRGVMIELIVAEASGAASDEKVARFAPLIEEARSTVGAEALGWRAYKAKDFAGAARWLKAALDWRQPDDKPSLDIARAYADALRQLKRYDEALAFVAAWRERLPGLEAVGIDIGLDSLSALDPASAAASERVKAIAASIAASRSSPGARSLGWLAYGRHEFSGAEAWFRQAIVWTPAGAEPDLKALEGYARALQGEQRLDDFVRFAQQWSARVPALKPLFVEAAAQAFGAAAAAGEPLPTSLLAQAGQAFAEAHSANGAQALAWQRISQRDYATAAAWFRAAGDWSKPNPADPKILEGLIIALRNLHQDEEAEALAYHAGLQDDSMREIYIEGVADRLTRKPAAPPDAQGLSRFAKVVLAAKSGNGAQSLGWYSFNARQYEAAAAWFEKAVAFEPTENAAFGLAIAYRKLRDPENYQRVLDAYRDTYAKVADLEAGRRPRREGRAVSEDDAPRRSRAAPSEDASPRAAPAEDASPRAARLEDASPRAAWGRAGASEEMALGWRLLNHARPAEAARAFDAALTSATGKQRRDAAYGRSLALLSAGDGAGAARGAADVDLDGRQRNDLGQQLLEKRAWDAYDADRYAEALAWLDRRAAYAPETRALMQMRVWCLQKLGRLEAAGSIQGQLDQQLGR